LTKQTWDKQIILKRKEYLTTPGCIDTNLYFISSGSLKISIFNEEEEHIIRFGYAQNFILPLDSFLTDKPTDYYIQALKKTTLKVVDKTTYLTFMQSTERNKLLWDTLLNQLILQLLQREKDLVLSSPKERYERVLERSPLLFQEIPNKYIASYLGMSPETLSRLKKS